MCKWKDCSYTTHESALNLARHVEMAHLLEAYTAGPKGRMKCLWQPFCNIRKLPEPHRFYHHILKYHLNNGALGSPTQTKSKKSTAKKTPLPDPASPSTQMNSTKTTPSPKAAPSRPTAHPRKKAKIISTVSNADGSKSTFSLLAMATESRSNELKRLKDKLSKQIWSLGPEEISLACHLVPKEQHSPVSPRAYNTGVSAASNKRKRGASAATKQKSPSPNMPRKPREKRPRIGDVKSADLKDLYELREKISSNSDVSTWLEDAERSLIKESQTMARQMRMQKRKNGVVDSAGAVSATRPGKKAVTRKAVAPFAKAAKPPPPTSPPRPKQPLTKKAAGRASTRKAASVAAAATAISASDSCDDFLFLDD